MQTVSKWNDAKLGCDVEIIESTFGEFLAMDARNISGCDVSVSFDMVDFVLSGLSLSPILLAERSFDGTYVLIGNRSSRRLLELCMEALEEKSPDRLTAFYERKIVLQIYKGVETQALLFLLSLHGQNSINRAKSLREYIACLYENKSSNDFEAICDGLTCYYLRDCADEWASGSNIEKNVQLELNDSDFFDNFSSACRSILEKTKHEKRIYKDSELLKGLGSALGEMRDLTCDTASVYKKLEEFEVDPAWKENVDTLLSSIKKKRRRGGRFFSTFFHVFFFEFLKGNKDAFNVAKEKTM